MLQKNDFIKATNEPKKFQDYLMALTTGESLTYQEAKAYMSSVLNIADPNVRSAQLAILLNALMIRKPSLDEAKGAIDGVFEFEGFDPSNKINVTSSDEKNVLLAGSGKKGLKTINITTSAMLIAATAGLSTIKLASHSTSSMTGSVDVLSILGADLTLSDEDMLDVFTKTNVGVFQIENQVPQFDEIYGGVFYAPHVLSLAFPALLAPVKTNDLIYGLAHPNIESSLELFRKYGYNNAMVISAELPGRRFLDELSTIGKNSIKGLIDGEVGPTSVFNAASILDLEGYDPLQLSQGNTKKQNVIKMLNILQGGEEETQALVDTIALNASLMLYVGNKADGMKDGFSKAKEIIKSGEAYQTLKKFIEATRGNFYDPR